MMRQTIKQTTLTVLLTILCSATMSSQELLDDVISTGESLTALERLCAEAGGEPAGKAAVLAEGDAADRDDIIFLEKLPLFFK